MTRRWIVAFNRDRDFYQVPLALQERNLLAGLITDFYLPPLGSLTKIRPLNRIAHRRNSGIPFRKVRWNPAALRLQLLNLRFAKNGSKRIEIFKKLDKNLSRSAFSLAQKQNADLLLYSGYAREAFESAAQTSMRKGLFIFHPHGKSSLEILESDLEKHPEIEESHRWHRTEIELSDSDRLDAETEMADFLICASSFTAKSIAHRQRQNQPLAIAPYGCFPSEIPFEKNSRQNGKRSFLFVGQGVQRKGIHHLLKVWRKIDPSSATLTIVASSFDPGLQRLADHPSIRLLGSQSHADLQTLYHRADVFIMPSLIEGFGLVYLEALSAGCFVIGSENSGLPDLNLPADCGRVLPAGNLEKLAEAIENAIDHSDPFDPIRIRQFADSCRWSSFRKAVADACEKNSLSSFESPSKSS